MVESGRATVHADYPRPHRGSLVSADDRLLLARHLGQSGQADHDDGVKESRKQCFGVRGRGASVEYVLQPGQDGYLDDDLEFGHSMLEIAQTEYEWRWWK